MTAGATATLHKQQDEACLTAARLENERALARLAHTRGDRYYYLFEKYFALADARVEIHKAMMDEVGDKLSGLKARYAPIAAGTAREVGAGAKGVGEGPIGGQSATADGRAADGGAAGAGAAVTSAGAAGQTATGAGAAGELPLSAAGLAALDTHAALGRELETAHDVCLTDEDFLDVSAQFSKRKTAIKELCDDMRTLTKDIISKHKALRVQGGEAGGKSRGKGRAPASDTVRLSDYTSKTTECMASQSLWPRGPAMRRWR